MAKKPRPSISDQLAAIAGSRPSDVATLSRDNAVMLPRESVSRDQGQRDSVAIGNVADRAEGPDGYKRRIRYEKPHASVYAHPKVFKALREIAAAQDCKPHDLYLEGLRLVLREYGRDFDALNRGE